MSKEAMKLALEALEVATTPLANDRQEVLRAQAALREALAEQPAQQQPAQQEPVAWMDGYRNIYSLEEKAAGCPEATIALVPMANHKKTSGSPIKELNCICGAVWEGDELVHLPRPPAQQEPVAWRNAALRVGEDLCSVGPFGYYDMTAKQWLDWALSVVTVHAPPASKPWVGLTKQEFNECVDGLEDLEDCWTAIEAKLKEKNNG